MLEITGKTEEGKLVITLSGRIDSGNAKEAEAELQRLAAGKGDAPVILDAGNLEYISSAGLRAILHLKKDNPDLTITNAHPEIYDILDMTGFTQMMTVKKAFRAVSVEGCEEIGRGSNGTVYRIDQDNVVKVYHKSEEDETLTKIQRERELARKALVLGIPTAISYEVVRVGDSYGSVFELLNARSFSAILGEEPDRMGWCVQEYVKLLRKLHGTAVPAGELPDMREKMIAKARLLEDYLPEASEKKLLSLLQAVPIRDTLLHGDLHTNNVELVNGEVLLIDMDKLSVGHPVFELAFMFNAFRGFHEYEPEGVRKFLRIDMDTARTFWDSVLGAYLGTRSSGKIREVENKARVIGYTFMLSRSIRKKLLDTERGRAEAEIWKKELIELLDATEMLAFTGNEIEIEADRKNLQTVLNYIGTRLEETDCPQRAKMQVSVAAEEIFVNIADYAYTPEKGKATVRVEVSDEPVTVTITFMDGGMPFDPLAKEDPDITLSAQERRIGGLGIFMTKKTMDEVSYEYKDGKNILMLKKNL